MSGSDWSLLPEYDEWAEKMGQGLDAEVQVLTRLLRIVEQHGDQGGQYGVLFTLFSAYCRYGDEAGATGAIEHLERLMPLSASDYQRIAEETYLQLGNLELAERYVGKGLSMLPPKRDSEVRAPGTEFKLRSVALAVLVQRGADPDEVSRVLTTLARLAGRYRFWAYNEPLKVALGHLAQIGLGGNALVELIEFAWADAARNARFHGWRDAPLQHLEDMHRQAGQSAAAFNEGGCSSDGVGVGEAAGGEAHPG